MYEANKKMGFDSTACSTSPLKATPRNAMDCVRRMEETLERAGKTFSDLRMRLEPVLANHPVPELRLEKDTGEVPVDSVLVQQMNNQAARWETLLRDIETMTDRIQIQ